MKTHESQNPLLRTADALAEEVDPEPEHARQVCRLALALFDETKDLHGLGSGEREVLAVAALLHDTGWSTRPDAHHKGSRDVILDAKLPGLGKRARRMAACVARYHRKAHPKPTHAVYCKLDEKDQKTVGKLAALLRVADGLDRSHCASSEIARIEQKRGLLRLYLKQHRPNTLDLWGGMRKRGLFEDVFKLKLDILVPEGNA